MTWYTIVGVHETEGFIRVLDLETGPDAGRAFYDDVVESLGLDMDELEIIAVYEGQLENILERVLAMTVQKEHDDAKPEHTGRPDCKCENCHYDRLAIDKQDAIDGGEDPERWDGME